jgi:hypothetical protein
VGRFNDVSNEINNIIKAKEDSRVNIVGKWDERHGSNQGKAVAVGKLSTACNGAARNCLLDRRQQCGHCQGPKRRDVSHCLEEIKKKDTQIQWMLR